MIYSDDHGRTWHHGEPVRPKMNECQAVELSDGEGTLLLSMRNYLKEGRRAHSISHDGGVTWTAPELDAALPDPVCQASILRYNWPKGAEWGRILFSNPASAHRQNMTVRISYDDGKSWPISKSLHSGPSAYSCLAVLPDRIIGCLYERGNANAYEKITLAQFPMGWLEEN
jgi:sialidase-1